MYSVVVADPPWPFSDKLPEIRGAASHYKAMTRKDIEMYLDQNFIVDIAMTPLGNAPIATMLAPDCTLFLWRVSSMQQEALDVIRAWGFTLKTELVWVKKTKYGKRHFGMGRTVRAEHETCLIATRGKPVTLNLSIRSTFEAATGEHSEKPIAFYEIVEQLRTGPYLELFARRQRVGWMCVGDELPAAPV